MEKSFAKKNLTKDMELNQVLRWCLLVLLASCSADFPVEQPKRTFWLALAKAACSDTICLSNLNPEKCLSSCLVSMPVKDLPIPIYYDPLT